ncbi:MAG: dienelactone hydrolase family protein [Nitrososphaeraceae archaeon]
MSTTNNNEQEGQKEYHRLVRIPIAEVSGQEVKLEANLSIPRNAQGVVIFAHGSGSSRHSPRNRYVAQVLQNEGIATLLIDLLTEQEEEIDLQTRHLRFDIGLLSKRLIGATDWIINKQNRETEGSKVGYFGASTGAAAALVAAAEHPNIVNAVVSRGGRPDLAGIDTLQKVQASTLLIVGGNDIPVIEMNKQAYEEMRMLKEDNGNNNYNNNNKYKKKKLVIIPEATHLFEEPGKLEEVARLAAEWFKSYLK